MKKSRRNKKNGFLNLRLPAPIHEQLQQQAEKEDRTMAYLARVFIQAGLSDRNRGVRA
jgi:hypothetical protein